MKTNLFLSIESSDVDQGRHLRPLCVTVDIHREASTT